MSYDRKYDQPITKKTYEDAEFEALRDIGGCDLEEIVGVELLEDRSLDLGEVVGDEEREEGVVGAVDGHVDGRHVDEEEGRVDADVDESDEGLEAVRGEELVGVRAHGPVERVKHVLAEGREEPVKDLHHTDDHVELDHGLPADEVVHARHVQKLQPQARQEE